MGFNYKFGEFDRSSGNIYIDGGMGPGDILMTAIHEVRHYNGEDHMANRSTMSGDVSYYFNGLPNPGRWLPIRHYWAYEQQHRELGEPAPQWIRPLPPLGR